MRLYSSLLATALLCRLTGTAAEDPQLQPLSKASASARSAVEHNQPRAAYQQSVEYVLPELLLGGEWTSIIKLTNRSNKSIPTTNVYFMDNAGNPMNTTFQASAGNALTGTGFSFSLSPGGIIEGTFLGGANTQFGHAFVDLCSSASVCIAGLYAEVTIRNRNSSRPDFEAVFPVEQPTDLQYMLWDHRNGLATVLYLVNESPSTTTVSLDFINAANQLIRTVNVPMTSLSSQILTLNVLAPETVGIQGTLSIRGQNSAGAFVTATALRINPSNSFTPMRAFVPKL